MHDGGATAEQGMNRVSQHSFTRGNGVAEGEEGWFGMEIGVEGQRALGEAIFARAEAVEPSIAVGQTPGENGFHRVLAKNVFEIAAVEFGDETIALGDIGRQSRIVHIQFRYKYLQL